MLGVCNDCLRGASLLRASERGKRTRGKHVPFLIEREVVTSRFHGSKISGPQQTEVLQVGGHNLSLPVPRSPASRTFLSFCHPTHAVYCVSPVSCKSRCLTPYSNRACFGLVQNKKWSCKSNHFALSSAIIKAAFLRHNFTPPGAHSQVLTPRSKIFNVL